QSLDTVFEHFDTRPLAAASIAQVHVARLLPQAGERIGAEVVFKVLRPGVQAQVARDMAVLGRLARLAERFVPRARRFRVTEVVSEYERVIGDELDLLREGGNASKLKRNWAGSDLIYHPTVYFDYSCEPVL